MTETTDLVFGESAAAIYGALSPALRNRRTTRDGMTRVEFELTPELGLPFARALMRAEAKLLLEDADQLTAETARAERTPDQRRYDGFMEIVEAMAALVPKAS